MDAADNSMKDIGKPRNIGNHPSPLSLMLGSKPPSVEVQHNLHVVFGKGIDSKTVPSSVIAVRCVTNLVISPIVSERSRK